MPPRHCLGQLPLRPALRPSASAPRAAFLPVAAPAAAAASFSTSAVQLKNPNQKKGNSTAGPPKKGVKGLRIAKKGSSRETGRRPAPGERKALRKRIVLSNTNALEVPGLADLKPDDIGNSDFQGKVLGIPGDPVVDQLRAAEAFKSNQGWGLFRRPAMLMRRETAELSRLVSAVHAEAGGKVVRRVIHGERASGKTTLLLQAMTMAFLKDWVVINFPDAKDLTIGHTAYAPAEGTNPPQYVQKAYAAALLGQIARANEKVLEKLKLSEKHNLPVTVKDDATLLQLAKLGAADADAAWPVFQAFWKELTKLSNEENAELARPPVMVCLDNLAFIMNDTEYLDRDGKPIHAHDLLLVRHYIDLLAGTKELPNGGMVLAATSGSNTPKAPSMDYGIELLEAKQAGEKVLPQWNPYKKVDERCLKALSNVEAVRLKGLTHDEARAIMEYYAQSGMMRRTVDERLVSEKWTVSGGGIIGELERATVRYRI